MGLQAAAVPQLASRPKISGGAAQLSIPGLRGPFTSGTITAQALAINTLRYMPFEVQLACTLDQVVFEVTAAPASDAHVRVGIYAADHDQQPSGAPVLDVEVAVASGFTGVKTTTVSVPLPRGVYVGVVNVDVAMTLRALVGDAVSPGVPPAMGANLVIASLTVANNYAATPTTPVPWTTVTAATASMRHVLFYRIASFP